jgi:hypothetical protein
MGICVQTRTFTLQLSVADNAFPCVAVTLQCYHYDTLTNHSMCLVIQAMVMIKISTSQKKFYDRMSALNTLDIVEDIRECDSPLFHWPYIAYDSGKLREGAEYKLLQLIFLQEYALPKGFDFAAYMQQALDENIISNIEVW